ncbi:MAG TPA: LPS export ABC transporter permease LptG [Xanthomonadaceae bacterium]
MRAVFSSLLIVWAVLLAFESILDFANQLDSVGKGNYSLGHVVLYILCTIPRRIYELFPTSALIGSLLGLGGLAATSELTALRSAGLSRWRISIGAVAGLAVVTLLMIVDMETIGPLGEQTAEAIQISAKSSDMMVSRGGGVWARDGNVFVDARGGAKRLRSGGRQRIDLLDVRLFQFDAEGTLLSLMHAGKAEYDHGHWTLSGLDRTDFAADTVKRTRLPDQEWKTGLRPETVLAGIEHPRYQSTRELKGNIDYMRRNAVDAGEFENAYWERCFYPLNVLAMCLAVLPFAFGQLRSGGFGKRLFAGILCGLTFFVLQKFAQDIATIYRLPLWGAHVAPPLLVLAVSQWYFRKRA